MRYDKKLIAGKLDHWETFINTKRLPKWEELPNLDLYMDQVIAVLNDTLGYFAYDASCEKLVTAAMVNNYVKMKLIPAPVKKKYGRRQLASLVMICTLKQVLSIADIKRILPAGDDAAFSSRYDAFIEMQKRLSRYFAEQVRTSAADVFDESSDTGNEVANLVLGAAVAASYARLMAGKIIALGEPEKPQK